MDKRAPRTAAKPPSTVLGLKAFAAITAVEGLKLSPAGRQRVERLTRGALTPEQRRAKVLRAYQDIKSGG
jgi:hypothetical protein